MHRFDSGSEHLGDVGGVDQHQCEATEEHGIGGYPGESQTWQAETHQVMKNLQAVLDEAKITFAHVVKTTIFLSDMSLFSSVNEVYGKYFIADFPARETVAVKGLPKNVNVEISMIAGR